MKQYFLILLAICSVAKLRSIETQSIPDSKIYIDSKTVQIAKEGILYQTSQGNYEVTDQLFCDDRGVYVLKFYQCPACGRWNRSDYCVNQFCQLYGK
ncbi:MAG: hypothetical protein ACSNEK_05725 [Parachlamydiaceae bacterium]